MIIIVIIIIIIVAGKISKQELQIGMKLPRNQAFIFV